MLAGDDTGKLWICSFNGNVINLFYFIFSILMVYLLLVLMDDFVYSYQRYLLPMSPLSSFIFFPICRFRAQVRKVSCMILLQMAEMELMLTSKYGKIWQSNLVYNYFVYTLFLVFFGYLSIWLMLYCNILWKLLIYRFDYLLRDCRACGLGCNFEFQRFHEFL